MMIVIPDDYRVRAFSNYDRSFDRHRHSHWDRPLNDYWAFNNSFGHEWFRRRVTAYTVGVRLGALSREQNDQKRCGKSPRKHSTYLTFHRTFLLQAFGVLENMDAITISGFRDHSERIISKYFATKLASISKLCSNQF